MMEILEPIGAFIERHGFPIFVATFLLIKVERTLVRIWKAQNRTNVVLAVLVKVLTDSDAAIPEEVVDEVSGVVGVAHKEGD